MGIGHEASGVKTPGLRYKSELVSISRGELETLRRKANYYESQFNIKKKKIGRVISQCRELKAAKKNLWKRLFGRKSECGQGGGKGSTSTGKRGKKNGQKGSGRNKEAQLETTAEIVTLGKSECQCPKCGKNYRPLAETADSEVIEVEVKAHRRIIKRQRYKKTCQCPKVPTIISAPVVPKVIPKGKFGITFWVHVLLRKFCFHQPLNRVVKELKLLNLPVSAGTIVGGFKHIEKLMVPIYQAIERRNKGEHHWHADETRWMVFEKVDGKVGHRWYLWVFHSETTVFFKVAPTRGAKVVKEHYGESWGVLNVDRYSSYKTLLGTGLFLLAYCWAHVRRDYLEVEVGYPQFSAWVQAWVKLIGDLYHINNERLRHEEGSATRTTCQVELENQIAEFKVKLERELLEFAEEIPSVRYKVLLSLQNHWQGLTLFVQFPWVPMDNNKSERELRDPVVGRKNYYGSGAVDSALFSVEMFSIFSTLELWTINPLLWLTKYLSACANNKGKAPENLDEFLPWTMESKRFQELGGKTSPKCYAKITKEQIKCATVDEFFVRKKSKLSNKSSLKPPNPNIAGIFQKKYVGASIGPSPTVV